MFTHQDTAVWSDLIGIFWAAGLQVVAAWYIATETTSELKKGGYVQGTVILIIDVDANGNVTNVSVEKSSRNRDLDRAAMDAARKWRFNPGQSNGQRSAGRVRVPVDFMM